jgi:hypothetical protein
LCSAESLLTYDVFFSPSTLFGLKNEKNRMSEYVFYFILLYIRRAISAQTNPKSGPGEKKHHLLITYNRKHTTKLNIEKLDIENKSSHIYLY